MTLTAYRPMFLVDICFLHNVQGVPRELKHLVISRKASWSTQRDIFADKICLNVAIPLKKSFRKSQIF